MDSRLPPPVELARRCSGLPFAAGEGVLGRPSLGVQRAQDVLGEVGACAAGIARGGSVEDGLVFRVDFAREYASTGE
jgi:hypothetical protein